MASYNVIMNQIALDSEFYVWGTGQDLRRFDGNTWEYYDYTNSSVPDGSPFFLDTRCISIDNNDNIWCGVAQGPLPQYNQFSVFNINSKDVNVGNSWYFSDLGTFDSPQEISHIYACPFSDEVLAFSTPLNGIGGTGATSYSEIHGVTGGRLFFLEQENNKWTENVSGYNWPHIYDIKARGHNGNEYFYYVCTSEGLFVIPPGILEKIELSNAGEIIKQARVYNTKTSGIISDMIYSIDIDEDNNIWLGTDLGLSFFDGIQFWNYPITTGPVTKITVRDNGHVFYTSGDGELYEGTGLWHFNGVLHTQYNSIGNDDILDIKLVENTSNQNNLIMYEDSLWVLGLNNLISFNYDQPHIYGSSNHIGATGWNFTYTNENKAVSLPPIPKVNKYTWTYPQWRVYQDEYLEYMFPGLDERNLFLTTKLKDVIDGSAGNQSYWDNNPIASYEENTLGRKIQEPDWANEITITQNSSIPGSIDLTSSTSVTTEHGIKYYIGGYLSGDVTALFGKYDFVRDATLRNLNPTLGGRADTSISDSTSLDYGKMGFIVCYNEIGTVESILPFRGYSTMIHDLKHSEDGTYLVAGGTFLRYIEEGAYVWDSLESEYILRGSPAGSPAGITNSNVAGLTAGTYPWITGSTGPFLSGTWNSGITGAISTSGNFEISYSTGASYENINGIGINYIDALASNKTTLINDFVTGNTICISGTTCYRIDSIINKTSGLYFGVTYMSGLDPNIIIGNSFVLTGYDYHQETYPLIKDLIAGTNTWESPAITSPGLFIYKIGIDLGNASSFANLGINANYNTDIRRSYRGLGFRHFPTSVITYGDANINIKLDTSRYSINLGITSSFDFTGMTGPPKGGFATLSNEWNRNMDYYGSPKYILETTDTIAHTNNSDVILGYVRLANDTLSILSTTTSETKNRNTLVPNRSITDLVSLENNNSILITGTSNGPFIFGNISFYGTDGVYAPYYLIIDENSIGITGGFISGITGSDYIPVTTKNRSTYYISTVFNQSGNYFGNDFTIDEAGTYFLTSEITEHGISKSFFNSYFETDGVSLYPKSSNLIGSDQYSIAYGITGATGYNTGIFKCDLDGMLNENTNFGNSDLSTFTTTSDAIGNLFMSGYNVGGTGSNYYNIGSKNAFSLISKKYIPELGVNMGNIISRPGTNAWNWCDVHSTDANMKIPLLSTVVFNNYASNIYGKKNNKWILKNSVTDEEILNVKNSPYFIFTFVNAGNYTIENSVEDSAGNVYVISKPGYIEVIDHKQKNPDDINPDFVDSFDYGYPAPVQGRNYEIQKLAKSLEIEQLDLLKNNIMPFGSGLVIPDNPEATFRTP
jgi:hypothetical protein